MQAELAGQSARMWLEKGFLFPFAGRSPLQVVRWTGDRVSVAAGTATANVQLPANAQLIELSATENCYIAFGADNSIEATNSIGAVSRLFMAGVQVVPVPLDPDGNLYTWIAALRAGASDGILQIERVN